MLVVNSCYSTRKFVNRNAKNFIADTEIVILSLLTYCSATAAPYRVLYHADE